MMRQLFKLCSIAVLSLAGMGAINGASAALYNKPLARNAYIIYGGMKWAWASPFTSNGSISPGTSVDLSYQGKFGWRMPTAAELLKAPKATHFLFAGGNVPNGGKDVVSGSYFGNAYKAVISVGSAGACAAAYFGTSDRGCFYAWGAGSGKPEAAPWWGQPGSNNDSEVLVVSPVPIPAALPLLIGALGGLAALSRTRKRQVRAV